MKWKDFYLDRRKSVKVLKMFCFLIILIISLVVNWKIKPFGMMIFLNITFRWKQSFSKLSSWLKLHISSKLLLLLSSSSSEPIIPLLILISFGQLVFFLTRARFSVLAIAVTVSFSVYPSGKQLTHFYPVFHFYTPWRI